VISRRRWPWPVSTNRSVSPAVGESVDALDKTELVRGPGRGPWRSIDDLERATLSWVHCHNTERLHGYPDEVPPAEFEAAYDAISSGTPLVGITA